MTRTEDAVCAAEAGADAVGMIFYGKSPRNVSLEQAQKITSAVQPFVTTVAVVVEPPVSLLESLRDKVRIDRIQYHGTESDADCSRAGIPYYKALRIRPDSNIREMAARFPRASAVLLDNWAQDKVGGTGQRFDWSLVRQAKLDKPIVLAGGLDSVNVREAILAVRPFAVDVVSGVESAPGIKDATRMNEFIIAVREADLELQKLRNSS